MTATAPWSKVDFAQAEVIRESLSGGGYLLRSAQTLGEYPGKLGEMLSRRAAEAPDRAFLAERDNEGLWRKVTYAEAAAMVQSIGQALLDRDLGAESPVAILSDNGIDNALLQLGAMQVGVPAMPVSPAYSLMSADHGKLRHIFALTRPALVYVADATRFICALAAVAANGHELVVSHPTPEAGGATLFQSLLDTHPTEAVRAAYDKVVPDTIAKLLFTSGSTGLPKGVVNTHRMLCSNQQAIRQLWPFLEQRPPVIVDWLPWNHTFGANHNFNMMLYNGGTIYIDRGKPLPGLIDHTVANLREISPTLYFNVPKGFDVLLPYLESDDSLRDHLFADLDAIFYAGAALPQNLWDRIEALSVASRGERIPLISAWGSTETAPAVTSVHFYIERAGVIGLPVPGTILKMTPSGSRLELRVKGPNVTPGYWNNEEQTAAAFDEEGYYCIGDAGRFADVDDPAKRVVFDGRIAEDFKLSSGTWVHVGGIRLAGIAAAAPVIQDAVVTGHDRDAVGLLVFPDLPGCRSLAPDMPDDAPFDQLIIREEVREALRAGLQSYNGQNSGSSKRITRVLLMEEPPSIDANEITDKGYLNQRAVLERRAALVDRLYASDGSDPDIVFIE